MNSDYKIIAGRTRPEKFRFLTRNRPIIETMNMMGSYMLWAQDGLYVIERGSDGQIDRSHGGHFLVRRRAVDSNQNRGLVLSTYCKI